MASSTGWDLTREGFADAVIEIRGAVQQGLVAEAAYEVARGKKSVRAKTALTCRELLKVNVRLYDRL